VTHGRKSDDRLQKVNGSTGFFGKERNFGGWWGGLYRRKWNTLQWVGVLVLLVVYLGVFVVVGINEWPRVEAPLWKKIFYGYGPYAVLSLPLLIFLIVLRWRMGRPTPTDTHRPQ